MIFEEVPIALGLMYVMQLPMFVGHLDVHIVTLI